MSWEHKITKLICPKCAATGEERISSDDWGRFEASISREFHWEGTNPALCAIAGAMITHECGATVSNGPVIWE